MLGWFKNISIPVKLTLTLVLPFAGLIGYSSIAVIKEKEKWDHIQEISELMAPAPDVGGVIHELQAERSEAVSYLASGGDADHAARLTLQLQNTDRKIGDALDALDILKELDGSDSYQSMIEASVSGLEGMLSLRSGVQNKNISETDTLDRYTSINTALLDVIGGMASHANDTEFSNDVTAYIAWLQVKENAALERAIGAEGFGHGYFKEHEISALNGYIRTQESFLWFAKSQMSENFIEYINRYTSSPILDRVKDMRAAALNSHSIGTLSGITETGWLEATGEKLNLMKKVEQALEDNLLERVRILEAEEANAFYSMLIISLVVLIITIILAVVTSSTISKPVRRLTDLLDGSIKELPNSDMERRDELGSLSKELTRLLSEAVENRRIKTALDNCNANVMVADPDRNIVYMNQTMDETMRAAESDLRKDLSQFDASKLIGTNIDSFHKNPAHQIGLLSNLKEPYHTSIEVGGRSFNLIASPVFDGETRIGTVVEWDDRTDALAKEQEEARIAAENYRLKTALDSCNANVMVADPDRNIVYMNETMVATMRNAEADLKKELVHFDANKLLGANIDGFHKNPDHQRMMLEKLSSTYRTQIVVGGRTFNLVASPINDESNTRLGTIVEWADMTDEVQTQREVDDVVSAVANGDFSKSIATAGKEGFMLGLSESINTLNDNVSDFINDVANSLALLARGNLDATIDKDYNGTFETLKQDVNQMVDRLSGTVSDIVTASAEVNSASTEIAAGSTDLSQRTEQQASNLEETAASMEEMATTVKQNAENAQTANQLAITARQTAESGGDVVSNAVQSMSKIEESSQKVSDIIGVIDEIAFQTNLLALNAAVEAARAGEAGKGFAVVASEVRTLAQRSSEAARDIKGLILDSNAQVKDGVQLVNETGQSLSEIVDSIKRVADIVSEIAAASGEQAIGVEEINASIANMDEMTQQNAALVEESTASARSLEQQSEHLTEVISFFSMKDQQVASPKKPKKPANTTSSKPAPAPRPAPQLVANSSDDDDWEEF